MKRKITVFLLAVFLGAIFEPFVFKAQQKDAVASYVAYSQESTYMEREILRLEARLTNLKKELTQKSQENSKLSHKLEKEQRLASRVPELMAKVVELKNELLIKEHEVELVARTNGLNRNFSTKPAKNLAKPAKQDVKLVIAKADKVNLRSGPGEQHSPVMQVQKNAQLLVESKEGNWYRVITPRGSRAYVRSDVVFTKADKSRDSFSSPKIQSDLVPFGSVNTGPQTTKIDRAASPEEQAAFKALKAAMFRSQ